MTRTEHLLCILAEECAEVAQRVSKALRFGIDEIQPNQSLPLNNASRIKLEMIDLLAVWGMLCNAGVCEPVALIDEPAIYAKQEKIEKFLIYSEEQGTLTNDHY